MPISISTNIPTASSSNVTIHSYVQIVFSTGLDENTVGEGTLFIEGPDNDIMSGPYAPIHYQGSSLYDVFEEPSYHGIVNGTYEFDEVTTDRTSPVTIVGTSTSEEYLSRVTFYPIKPLSPLTTYNVYLVGTGTGQTATDQAFGAISRRTVFESIADTGNSGNGYVRAYGGHTARGTHTYDVEVLSSGVVGAATYKWRRDSDSYSQSIRTHSFSRALNYGVSVAFSGSGTFQPTDSYAFTVREPEYMTGFYVFSFVTGESGTQILTGAGSSILSTVAPAPLGTMFPGLSLAYTYPTNPSCNISIERTSFTFYFNKALDTSSINAEGIEIYVGPPDGDTTIRSATQYTATSWTASASSLTINI